MGRPSKEARTQAYKVRDAKASSAPCPGRAGLLWWAILRLHWENSIEGSFLESVGRSLGRSRIIPACVGIEEERGSFCGVG